MFVLPKLNLEIELPKKLDVEKTASVGEMMLEYLIQIQGVKNFPSQFYRKLSLNVGAFVYGQVGAPGRSMFGSYHEENSASILTWCKRNTSGHS